MGRTVRRRIDAFLCSGFLFLCVLIAHPMAEIGMHDDFSYIKSAQVLASTGHIAYNGWAAFLLGWQLYIGALFIKVFGFSFAAVRASTIVVALVMVFLVQRIYVRLGINSRNAILGTLALIACPLFLPLAVSFMSDVDGLFGMVLCFYACLRSLQAPTARSTLVWLIFAAILGALSGTVRQICWLGVLVLFPCTVWLVRRRPRVVLVGTILYIASAVFIFASMKWFSHQPYSIPEHILGGSEQPNPIRVIFGHLLGILLSLPLFLLPILSAFAASLLLSRQRAHRWFALGATALGIAVATIAVAQLPQHDRLLAPFLGNSFDIHGDDDCMPILGARPIILGSHARFVISAATYVTLFVFLLCLLLNFHRSPKPLDNVPPRESQESVSWTSLLTLIVPIGFAYFAFLVPRMVFVFVFDRYLLPLLFLAIPVCLRFYQERMRENVPLVSWIVVSLSAAYSISATHDIFSMYRARLATVRELEMAGIPPTSIDAGLDFDGSTQIDADASLAIVSIRAMKPSKCRTWGIEATPIVHPRYALSFDPDLCGGPSNFPVVSYHNWLGPPKVNIYVVKTD